MQARFFLLFGFLAIVTAHMHHGPSPMPGHTTEISSPTQAAPPHPPPRGRPNHGPVPGRHRPSPKPMSWIDAVDAIAEKISKVAAAHVGHPSPKFRRWTDEEVQDEQAEVSNRMDYGLRRLDLEELASCPIPGERKCLVAGMGDGLGNKAYECIDTSNQSDSCGGCVLEGDGEDCSQLPNVSSVRCELGSCQILSCANGYELSFLGESCIMAR